MEIVVFTENETYKTSLAVHNGELVDLVVPDYVIGFLERCAFGSGNELLDGGHELAHFGVEGSSADTVITCRDKS